MPGRSVFLEPVVIDPVGLPELYPSRIPRPDGDEPICLILGGGTPGQNYQGKILPPWGFVTRLPLATPRDRWPPNAGYKLRSSSRCRA